MRFDPYVRLVVEAARRRGITVRPVPGMGSGYAELLYQGHREIVCQSITDRTGVIAFRLMFDKAAAMGMLAAHGFPVPPTLHTRDLDDARRFLATHRRVVVKPSDRSGGRAVTTDIRTEDVLETAFEAALGASRRSSLLVQKHLEGEDHRILVIGERVFGVQRLPAHVVGNGEHSVRQLIEAFNDATELSVRRIRIDKDLKHHLGRSGFELDTVPSDGAAVWLRERANAGLGGYAIDTTELLADELVQMARDVAALFDAPVVGVDLICDDITRPEATIIELNPHPGLTLHHHPNEGRSRDAAGALLDMLFPETVR